MEPSWGVAQGATRGQPDPLNPKVEGSNPSPPIRSSTKAVGNAPRRDGAIQAVQKAVDLHQRKGNALTDLRHTGHAWDNVGMRYFLLSVVAVALAASFAGTSQGVRAPLTFTVALVQQATYRHPHPPDGDPGDTFLDDAGPECGRHGSRVPKREADGHDAVHVGPAHRRMQHERG